MLPELRLLHYFLAVADAGQVTRAAESLCIAQPALSQALARLERQLGVELLERHAGGVEVTPVGALLAAQAREVLAAAAAAVATAREWANRPPGSSCSPVTESDRRVTTSRDSPSHQPPAAIRSSTEFTTWSSGVTQLDLCGGEPPQEVFPMRVRKSVSMVAAVVSVAGVSAPSAYAFDSLAPGAGAAPPVVRAQAHHRASSSDWLLIGVGTAGAITLAGAGVGATRRGRVSATTRGERLVTR